jgi:tRNA 2-thiouridine synthesizing protein A
MMQVSNLPGQDAKLVLVDARGLACPLPLLKAKQALRHMQSGECLRLEATDPGSLRDIKVFAEMSGHKLLLQTDNQGVITHVLQKA